MGRTLAELGPTSITEVADNPWQLWEDSREAWYFTKRVSSQSIQEGFPVTKVAPSFLLGVDALGKAYTHLLIKQPLTDLIGYSADLSDRQKT